MVTKESPCCHQLLGLDCTGDPGFCYFGLSVPHLLNAPTGCNLFLVLAFFWQKNKDLLIYTMKSCTHMHQIAWF